MATPGPGAAHSSPRGCLLWGSIGVVFLLLVVGSFTYWVLNNSTDDPEKARAWAAEMIDLEFPAEAPASSAVQLYDITMVFGGDDVADPLGPTFTVVGSLGEERFQYDQLARFDEQQEEDEVQILSREDTEFQVRGAPVRTLRVGYEDGTVDYSLLLDGKTTAEGRVWQIMLIFKGPPAVNTPEWVQSVLETVR
ncbi:MAG: hypothetical protein ISR76_04825 [Planctomycetes bacterium]|nr:hypothetical protein [Planctomycetota bacterium]MBL7008299.1 hypothetical protein [Planctomycetota bacterium]